MSINRIPSLRLGVAFCALAFLLTSCKQDTTGDSPASITPNNPTPVNTSIPKTPGAIPEPADNQSTPAKIELGRHLFFDKTLSVDGTTSCGSCHDIGAGLSDIRGLATSMGFEHQMGTRNAPALANVAYNTAFTWDGKFKTLEEHAPGPIFNSLEMGNNFTNDPRALDSVPSGYNSKPGPSDTLFLFKRLNGRSGDLNGKTYPDMFIAAWGTPKISMDKIAKSIAAYERTFISTQSDFDKYNNGDQTVFKYNPEALHGLKLFTDVNGANCISCHSGYNFTDQQYHDNGIGINQQGDKGRFAVSKNQSDVGKFKTPSLRNVALSAPYMHDGRFPTLEKVLSNYNTGGVHSANQDPKIKALNLSDQDISDIIEFLHSLTDHNFVSDRANKFDNPWGK